MKKILLMVWLTVLGIGHADISSCPCSVDSNQILTCDSGTIRNFPDDIPESCSINPDKVKVIQLWDQPLSELRNRSFSKFPNLLDITLPFNKISFVAQDAFYGLTHLMGLVLSDNNITQIKKGTFDDLVSLTEIDVSSNEYLHPEYVTSSWHMCHREEKGLKVKGNLVSFKDLQMSQSTDLYCERLIDMQDYSGICKTRNTTLDCTGLDQIEDSICYLRKWAEGPSDSFTNILFDFPVDTVPTEVENFYEGESNSFFQDFNSFGEPTESKLAMNQLIKNLTFYSTKFDLSKLQKLTSRKTKIVTIWADTIFTSAPLTISHKTIIKARKVAIDHKITMNITKDQLLDDKQDVEIWAMKEEHIAVRNITMRQRKLGLLEILDQVSESNNQSVSSKKCNPIVKDAIKDGLDISNWFDFVHLNLMYVSAHTIQDSKKNAPLVNQIVDFTLNYTFDSNLINNQEIYSTSRKFSKLIFKNVHPIPSNSLKTIKKLAGVLYEKMKLYKNNEMEQERYLKDIRGRVEDMDVQFEIIEAQQKEYFSMEMIQLEAMWAATDNAWNFSFEHRNGIENSIQTAMEAMMNETFEMREKELTDLLNEAEFSVDHMQEVIDKYQTQIKRYEEKAEASFRVQKDQFNLLIESKNKLQEEFKLFEKALDHWQDVQEAKAATSFFGMIVGIFFGIPPNPVDIFDLIVKLERVWTMIDEILKMFNEMNLDEITDISMDPSTDFMTALNRAVDMKLEGPTFDEVKATGQIKISDLNEVTDHEVEHTTDVMMALTSIGDLGNRMIGEIGEFADNMLCLAERYDELKVAQNDLNRAIDEVKRIKEMIEGFEDEKNQFYSDREKARQDYEDEIENMKAEYEHMSEELREEYKHKIMEKFEKFKSTFSAISDSYNNRMSSLIESIQVKSYGLKQHSMNQRIIIMVLYADYCDAVFFYSFGDCSKAGLPLMSDSFDTLLEKLDDLEWNSITADNNFPEDQRPQDFIHTRIDIKDDPTSEFYPIQVLKNESKLELNITQYDLGFVDFWRIRINEINITMYDKHDVVIASPGNTGVSNGQIKVRITFPNIFIDQSGDKVKHSFLGPSLFCEADYWTHPKMKWEPCKISSEFSSSQFETTPNGLFTLQIKNAEEIRMYDIDTIRVHFSGSHIPYRNK